MHKIQHLVDQAYHQNVAQLHHLFIKYSDVESTLKLIIVSLLSGSSLKGITIENAKSSHCHKVIISVDKTYLSSVCSKVNH